MKCWHRTLVIGSLFVISLHERGILVFSALSPAMIEQFHHCTLNYSLIVHVISKLCFKLDLRDTKLSNTYDFIPWIQQLKTQDSITPQIISVKKLVSKIIRWTPPFKQVYKLKQYPKLSNGIKCVESVVANSKDTCIDGTKNCVSVVPLKRVSSSSKQARQRAAL